MGDSACLMHGFSYASAIPNNSKQGNPMHSLGESISFGRFMTESLSWEKWSTFSHKKYVEEAERYTQPGSVAQKKAFFEAHYKRIAAQKAAAAALLEQENAAKIEAQQLSHNHQQDIFNSLSDDVKTEIQYTQERESSVITVNEESPVKRNSISISQIDNQDKISVSESSGTPQIERPLLKQNCVASEDIPSVTSKKKSGLSSLKSSIQRKTWKVASTPVIPHSNKENNVNRKSSVDKKIYSPKSLRALMELIPTKGPNAATKKSETYSRTPKDCATALRTPIAASKSVSTYPAASTPLSENRRMKTPINSGSKTMGPKWHILSSVCSKSLTACRNKLQSPTLSSTPFILRTEERAAKRKQKLEEKFNANEVQKTQLQKTLKEKAGNEIRKLGCGFCFKARPLPDFYKEREVTKNQMKKIPAPAPQSAVLGKSISNKKQGTISMPPPPPPPKNGACKTLSRKNAPYPTKFITRKDHT